MIGQSNADKLRTFWLIPVLPREIETVVYVYNLP